MSNDDRLDGWKSIADHLGRDARTAQRWHRERGMPVHRVPGNHGGAVFAYRAELDGWLNNGAAKHVASPLAIPSSKPTDPKPSEFAATGSQSRARMRPHLVLITVVAVLTLTGAVSVTWVRIASHTSPAVPTRVELNGPTLSAFDDKNDAAWTFQLAHNRSAAGDAVVPALENSLPIDLNADGSMEMVATINYTLPRGHIAENAEVYCFGPRGNVLWRYAPDRSLSFRGREFAVPWRVYAGLAADPEADGVWVSFIDRTWWPSFVVRLDANGRERLMLVNAGHVQTLQGMRVNGKALMLAGGFNNEAMLPALAAIDARSAGVTSPQTAGSVFECDNCPTGHPMTYLLFPRSDVNVALGRPFIFVSQIDTLDQAGNIDISVRDTQGVTRAVYRLDADLTPKSVAFSDTYWQAHRQLSEAGKVGHTPEDCPEKRQGVVVRIWRPATGWKDVRVGPRFPPNTD